MDAVTLTCQVILTHNRRDLKSPLPDWTLTQILSLTFQIKHTTMPLIHHLPLPAGLITLQYHRMKHGPCEQPTQNIQMLLYYQLRCQQINNAQTQGINVPSCKCVTPHFFFLIKYIHRLKAERRRRSLRPE